MIKVFVFFFCPLPTSVDWTPDYYESSYEYYNHEENSSDTLAYQENPNWYYTEEGRCQSCSGDPPGRRAAHLKEGLCVTVHASISLLLSDRHHKMGTR